MVACSVANQNNQKTKRPKTAGKTQIPQPDLRLTIKRTAKQTANGAGAQQKQPQPICQGHSGKKPLCRNKFKNVQQKLVPPNGVRRTIYVVAKKTTKNRISYTLSPNPASQSPLTSACSRAHVQKKSRYHKAEVRAWER